MSKKPQSKAQPTVQPALTLFLIGIALVVAALAVYQWRELVHIRQGGTASCAINETVNCEPIWNSAFASSIHDITGMPLAAWGLVWALVALALSVWTWLEQRRGESILLPLRALQVTAAVGIISCIVFAVVSARVGALCLTCLGTYVGVAAFAFVVMRMQKAFPKPELAGLARGAAVSAAITLAFYLVLLKPASEVPEHGSSKVLDKVPVTTSTVPTANLTLDEQRAADLISRLSEPQKLSLSRSLVFYKTSTTFDRSPYPVREVKGGKEAPVKLVEFTDLRCGHCRDLVGTLARLETVLPPGRMSIEPKQFPLDAECNSSVPGSDKEGLRCLGAKTMICLEGKPEYWPVLHDMFEKQQELTKDLIYKLAVRGSVTRASLDACLQDQATTTKLNQDIEFANKVGIEGTPLVLVNGKKGSPDPAFLYAIAMANGNGSSGAFSSLPASRIDTLPQQPDHTGHAH
jgi:protein-disulfide isomerase